MVLDSGVPLGFVLRDLMSYHGPGSPGGVAHGFKVMERALPLLEPDGPAGAARRSQLRRRSAGRARATPSSSCCGPSRTGATRSIPRSRGRSAAWTRERFVFHLAYRGRNRRAGGARGVRDRGVPHARAHPDPAPEQAARLDALKREMAERVMAVPAEAVYEPLR